MTREQLRPIIYYRLKDLWPNRGTLVEDTEIILDAYYTSSEDDKIKQEINELIKDSLPKYRRNLPIWF